MLQRSLAIIKTQCQQTEQDADASLLELLWSCVFRLRTCYETLRMRAFHVVITTKE